MGIRLRVRSCWTQSGGEAMYEFDQGRVVIGRASGADVRLPHAAVSATHATLRVHEVGYVLVDEGATNGTRVNGQPLAPGRPKPLRTGDRIDLAGFEIVVEVGLPVAEATSVEHTSAFARQMMRAILHAEGERSTAPELTVMNGPQSGKRLELPEPPARLVLGRGEGCDLTLEDADASREHAEVVRDLEGVLVRDLGSKNGLTVNGRRVDERRLRDRDELTVGSTVLVLDDLTEERLRALEGEPDLPYEVLEPDPPPPDEGPQAGANEGAAPAGSPNTAAGRAPGDGPRRPRARRVEWSTDLFIYVLSALVLAASVAGLVLLLRAG